MKIFGWGNKAEGGGSGSPVKEEKKPTAPEAAVEKEGLTVEEVITEYLCYKDADLPKEVKDDALFDSLKDENARKYARALIELISEKGEAEVLRVASELMQDMEDAAESLELPLSPQGKNKTWAIWDIAKQYYFHTHRGENQLPYEPGNPFESKEKQEEIINRHLGWEAYMLFHATPEWKVFFEEDPRFADALPLLMKEPKPDNGTLSSHELAQLGKCLRAA